MSRQYSSFGTYFSAMRKRAKLTYRELASRIGYSPAYLSDIEKGRRYPFSADKLRKLSLILGLNAEETNTMFDLAGESREVIPADIAEYLTENKGLCTVLRELRELKVTEADVDMMLGLIADRKRELSA